VTSTTTAATTTTELTTAQSRSNSVDSGRVGSTVPAQGTGYNAIRYDICIKYI